MLWPKRNAEMVICFRIEPFLKSVNFGLSVWEVGCFFAIGWHSKAGCTCLHLSPSPFFFVNHRPFLCSGCPGYIGDCWPYSLGPTPDLGVDSPPPLFFNHCIFKINSSYWSTAWAEAVNTTEFSASKHDFCCFYIHLYVLFLLCILYVSFLTYFSFCWFCLSDVNLNFLYTNLSCHFERSAKYLF